MAAVRNNERVVGIDAARGLAILLMVFSHGLHWVYTGTSHDLILLFGTLSVGDLAAPIFFTVAGLSLYLSVTSKLRKGVEPLTLVNRYRHRFAQIFFVGVCLSLYWGVLQAQAIALFAVASLFLVCYSRYGLRQSRLIILLLALFSLALHRLFVVAFPYFPQAVFLRGKLPLFAILGMAGIGFFSSILLDSKWRNALLIFAGGSLLAVSIFLHLNGIPLERFDFSPSFILFGPGFVIFLVGVFNTDCFKKSSLVRCLSYIGRDALFLFVFHYVALFVPVYLFGYYNSLGPIHSLLFSSFFALVIVFVAFCRRQSSFSIFQLTERIFAVAQEVGNDLVLSFWNSVSEPRNNL